MDTNLLRDILVVAVRQEEWQGVTIGVLLVVVGCLSYLCFRVRIPEMRTHED